MDLHRGDGQRTGEGKVAALNPSHCLLVSMNALAMSTDALMRLTEWPQSRLPDQVRDAPEAVCPC
jgi:hypothetical protein